jgi:hypothetical protein
LHDDALINRDDCTIIERADAPTAKQVAVIWVNEEGEAPFIKGNYVYLYFYFKIYTYISMENEYIY